MKKKAYYVKPLAAIVLPGMGDLLQEAAHASFEKTDDEGPQWSKESSELWDDDYFTNQTEEEAPPASPFAE